MVQFEFVVVPRGARPLSKELTVTLVEDNWDDYHFKTMYHVHLVDARGVVHAIGSVKIGQVGQAPDGGRTDLPSKFKQLDAKFFSVGLDADYYVDLAQALPLKRQREAFLKAIRDIAFDESQYQVAEREHVFNAAFLRATRTDTIVRQFRRIARGGRKLQDFKFAYLAAHWQGGSASSLVFDVRQDALPPTNVHAIIGSNGTGKTTLLRAIARDIDGETNESATTGSGSFQYMDGTPSFANVVLVSFSAFDPFDDPPSATSDVAVQRTRVGLSWSSRERDSLSESLTAQFVESMKAVLSGRREARWLSAWRHLATDPLLDASGLYDALEDRAQDEEGGVIVERLGLIFGTLSSGHKIALLTITRLVELVDERTLVLLDEPESHLHPPLLSAMIRSISSLMEERNGVAIVATHTPVVLQEIPASCAWVLSRFGDEVSISHPRAETFAESVSVLTADVFGLEVTRTGFHDLLRKQAEAANGEYESIVTSFGHQLGSEGLAIARSLAHRHPTP